MLKRLIAAIALATSVVFTQPLIAMPITALDWSTGGSPGGSALMRGWAFTTSTAFTVESLGWYDADLDGLASSHQVGIWVDGGALLMSGTVSAGTVDALVGRFRYSSALSGTTLLAAGDYVIGGLSTNADATFRNIPIGNVTTAAGLTYVQDRVGGSTFGRPDSPQGFDVGYFGPNFLIASVPEPTTLALLGLGLAGLGSSLRRKK